MTRLVSPAFAAACVFLFCAPAHAASDTPEVRVGAFYAWFLAHDLGTGYSLLRGAAIENYVAHDTVIRLRNEYSRDRLPHDVDYFLKVRDCDEEDWRAHIVTRPAIRLDNVAVVPVTFGSQERVNVLVFTRMFGSVWKITKVTDTQDYR